MSRPDGGHSIPPESSLLHDRDPQVGDVWRDDRAWSYGIDRRVMVMRLSGNFAHVVATPSGRHTRIHFQTLRRRFTLKHRLSWAVTDA